MTTGTNVSFPPERARSQEQRALLSDIQKLTKRYFDVQPADSFIAGETPIPLAVCPYGWKEAAEAIESILSTFVTMGAKVRRFEDVFAGYVGAARGVMVNSGSSANLLALSILTNPLCEKHIEPGEEVITPAVTFATTVYPILNVGAVPVLVDIDLDTFNISVEEVQKAITPKTRAIMPVHLVGNPCDMTAILDIAREHDLFVIEDACEAHGAAIGGRRVGSFGDLATFSFFFTHHITTIEGGMVMTSNDSLAELATALRQFGWIRDMRDREAIAARYPHLDPRFLFVNTGYNFRPTEIQAAFGIHQIKKLDDLVEVRRANAAFWTTHLKRFSGYLLLHEEKPGMKYAWYAYPVTVRPDAPFTREALRDFLGRKGLETRPILAGNIHEQPVMQLFNHRTVGDLPNAKTVQQQSFLFGNHQGIREAQREAVVQYFAEFMAQAR